MLRVGLVQMSVGSCKATNIATAVKLINSACSQGAKLVTLPECFNSPYGTQYFAEYAEAIPGNSTSARVQNCIYTPILRKKFCFFFDKNFWSKISFFFFCQILTKIPCLTKRLWSKSFGPNFRF